MTDLDSLRKKINFQVIFDLFVLVDDHVRCFFVARSYDEANEAGEDDNI